MNFDEYTHSLSRYFRQPPILIAGMSRSGTSLITRLLEQQGVFLGCEQNSNNEAIPFFVINKRVIRSFSEYWYNGRNTAQQLKQPEVRKSLIEEMIIPNDLWIKRHYLGIKDRLRYSIGKKSGMLWGWKDPRNTLTAPLWLELFPSAKVIGIVRHPVDVARSLYYFEKRRFSNKKKQGYAGKFLFTPLFSFKIWELYTQLLLQLKNELKDNMLLIKYEELNNEEVVNSLFSFAGVINYQQIGEAITINPRNYDNPEGIEELHQIINQSEVAKKFNYDYLQD